jgi:hypothetical protein
MGRYPVWRGRKSRGSLRAAGGRLFHVQNEAGGKVTKETIGIEEHKFRMQVVRSLTKLESLASKTEAHLKLLNGSVARQDSWIAQHPMSCGLREDVSKLKAAVLTADVAAQTSAKWWHALAPLIWLAAGALLVLCLVHSSELLKAFSKG